MKRKEKKISILLLMITVASGCFILSCQQQKGNESDRPNLVFIFPDQMRAQTLGFMEKEPVITPHLDKFSKESMVFTNAVSNSPVCSPYRAMLFSGKYPVANGVVANTTSLAGEYGIQLKEDERCWSDVLKDNGYSMGYIGKWHLDAPYEPYIDCDNNRGTVKWNEWCPPERRHGFNFWYAYDTYDRHMRPLYWTTHATRDSFHYVDQWGPEHEADMAIKYINNSDGSYRDNNKPFALVVSMNPPHMPYDQLPQRYVDMYDDMDPFIDALCNQPSVPDTTNIWGKYYRKNIKNQLAMVTGVDEQFGRITNALKEKGLDKNTIVVFTSDHGDCLGKHEMISKSNPYEESMNVPFMIRWPEKIKAGIDELLLSVPDIYPTLLDLVGLKTEIPQDIEGTSYAPILLQSDLVRPSSQLYFIMSGRLSKKRHSLDNMNLGERGVRTKRYTLYIDKFASDSTIIYLWDRKEDPNQLVNIADQNPRLVEKLIDEELKPWLRKTNDPWLNEESLSIIETWSFRLPNNDLANWPLAEFRNKKNK